MQQNYLKMRFIYVNMLLIYVNMQHNYDDMHLIKSQLLT